MDNLTHSLLSVVMARAGLGRLAPRANWVILAAANTPDLEVLSRLGGSLAYLDLHRGWTHSILLAPALALAPLGLWRLLVRRREERTGRWVRAYAAALAGVLSHLLLDWLNVYGVRLLSPWRQDWLRLDWLHVIDLWLWAILLLGVLAPMLGRLVSDEIGARRGAGRGWAWFALVMAAAYVGGRAYLHEQALGTMETRNYSGGAVQRIAAFPAALNPLAWTGLVENETSYRVYRLNLSREFDPESARVLYKPQENPAVDMARKTDTARRFLNFSQFPVWRTTPQMEPPGAVLVTLNDLRFGMPEEGRFEARILLDPARGVIEENFVFGAWERKEKR